MAKTASLTSGLVVVKGQAAPAVAQVQAPPPAEPVVAQVQAPPPEKSAEKQYHMALTVKLDYDRYEKLKSLGVKQKKKSQEIFVEALDLWFAKQQQ